MNARPWPRPIPCVITALELIGLDEPTMPPGRARQVISFVADYLADARMTKVYGSRLSLTGRHLVHASPIKPSGLLPFHIALHTVHLQANLLPHGVIVRGAIAIGQAAARGSIMFGQGVAEAERLRDEVALVPRVIVHPDLLRQVELNADLRAAQHTPMEELGYLRSLLRLDTDGLWFVDYLRALRSEVDDPEQYLDHLRDHHRLATRKLEASTVLDSSSRGWTWLWTYHRSVVTELKNEGHFTGQEVADIRIPASSPLVYRFPPSAKIP